DHRDPRGGTRGWSSIGRNRRSLRRRAGPSSCRSSGPRPTPRQTSRSSGAAISASTCSRRMAGSPLRSLAISSARGTGSSSPQTTRPICSPPRNSRRVMTPFPEDSREIRYDPNPSAARIHNSRAKVKCVCGPVGSGKTSVACWEFWQLCMVSRVPIRGVVIRESYRELRDSTHKTFFEWFGMAAEYREKDEVALLTLTGQDGVTRTHELFFRACRKESDASKFLSTEFAFAWLEEVVPAYTKRGVMGQGLPKGVFDIAKMRIRQRGAPYLLILLTCNPPNTRHWVYSEFFQMTPEMAERRKYALFRQPARENERYLPEGYYHDLLETLAAGMAGRFVLGEVVPIYDGVRVFPECQDNWHIVEYVAPVLDVPLTLGQDYGLTPCTLITQIVPGGQWRWLRELQAWNTGMRRFMEFLVPLLKQEFTGMKVRCIWQDNKGGNQRSQTDEGTCREILEAAGFTVLDGNDN